MQKSASVQPRTDKNEIGCGPTTDRGPCTFVTGSSFSFFRAHVAYLCRKLTKNAKKFDESLLKYQRLSGAKACKPCRSRQELSNGASEYLVEKTENTRQGAPENIPPS